MIFESVLKEIIIITRSSELSAELLSFDIPEVQMRNVINGVKSSEIISYSIYYFCLISKF